jgi:outer membrane immunogenic protein
MIRKSGWALAAVVSVAALGSASAADMAVKARPIVVPIYNWTGCYIGLSAGGKGVATRDVVYLPAATGGGGAFPGAALDLGKGEAETWIAGGQVGCNYQAGKWVFGVEGDAHGQKWSKYDVLAGSVLPFRDGSIYELRSDWQASVRGRIGYAMDRTLFYGTGGVAFTEVRAYANWLPIGLLPGVIATDTKTLTGGTVGAGVEHAVTDNFTLGLEGRYTWYKRENFNAGLVPVQASLLAVFFTNSPAYRDVKIETGEIIFKANWKFGPSTVVARY